MTGLQTVSAGVESFQSWALDPQARVGLGLPFFDEVTYGGLGKAECMLVNATSSVGKTWIGLNAIAANPHVPTLFFSLEMSWRQVVARLTAINTGVPTWELEKEIRAHQTSPAMQQMSGKYPLLLCDDSSALSTKQMHEVIKQAGEKFGHRIRLVVVDYLELVGGNGLLGKSEQVDRIAVKMRELSKDNDCSVIALHQVGKSDGGGGFKPLTLESGRYGGHQPFEVVLGAFAPKLNPELSTEARKTVENDIHLQILKNRISGHLELEGVPHELSRTTGKITQKGRAAVTLQPTWHQQPSFDEVDDGDRSILDDWED